MLLPTRTAPGSTSLQICLTQIMDRIESTDLTLDNLEFTHFEGFFSSFCSPFTQKWIVCINIYESTTLCITQVVLYRVRNDVEPIIRAMHKMCRITRR